MASPPVKSKSKRRWMQFSLRTGLIVVTALCVALGLWFVPMERKRRAVASIEALGGRVVYMPQAAIESFPIALLRHWLPRVCFDEIEEVQLTNTQVTDAELAHLERFANLHELWLTGTQVTDAGVANLQGLRSLKRLSLINTQVTDAGLVHLRGLTGLRELLLKKTRVTDAGLSHLQGLTNLQGLWLDDTQVTDAGLAHLQGLPGLISLHLANTHVTDAGVAQLRKSLPRCVIWGSSTADLIGHSL